MKWTARLLFLNITVSLVFLSAAFADDQPAPKTLNLSELIAEALARNPEIQSAR